MMCVCVCLYEMRERDYIDLYGKNLDFNVVVVIVGGFVV